MQVAGGSTISIDMTRDTGTANWISTISSGSSKVTDSFPLCMFHSLASSNITANGCSLQHIRTSTRHELHLWDTMMHEQLTLAQALLAIELDGVTWDFGQLVWNNVIMVSSLCSFDFPPRLQSIQVMNTTETSWCTKYVS